MTSRHTFAALMAELTEAIDRAERWCAARERQLALLDRRAARTQSRLVAAGVVRARS
jgi:hypothetical protein